ncbi:MAG: hypothetical protein QXH03_11345 [Candidatus Bathyarchaeia archaeon]
MENELFTVQGSVSGTGDYTLDSDLLQATVTYIRIPRGLKAKIWTKRIAGEAADVAICFTPDVTAPSPTWKNLDVQKLASAGEVSLEKRRPIVIHGFTGNEAFKITRLTGTGNSYITLEVEISEE